jgi:hypothetical protein
MATGTRDAIAVVRSGRSAGVWWAAAAAGTAVGVLLNLTAGRMPGSEPFGAEDVVDAVGGLVLGAVGVLLLRRPVAVGLGRALLATSVLFGAVWLTGGLADALTQGRPDPSWAARALDMLNGTLFVPGFALVLLAPLLLFPTGGLLSRRWRPVAWLAVGATAAAVLGTLLAPGPVDEDVPGWGANPFGVPGLGGVSDALQAAGLMALLACLVCGVAAIVVRLVTSTGVPRRRVALFSGLVLPALALVAVDTDGVLPGVATAVVVFGLLAVGIGWPLLGRPARG